MRANRYLHIAVIGATLLFLVLWQTAAAGPPEKPGNPGLPGCLAKVSELEERIEELEDMLQNFAPVPQTGDTLSLAPGDDGDLQMGVQHPDPRLTDNGDGTETDHLTGLIWLKNADCPDGSKRWRDALTFANSLYDGWTGDGSGGDCGLADGSSAGDWRLPNVRELYSRASISGGHWQGAGDAYWSSTNYVYYPPYYDEFAWYVRLTGEVGSAPMYMGFEAYVWPVRGGD